MVGAFVLGELLGRGGMADVHEAVHARWGHRLAIKLARATVADTGLVRALDREIRAVAALDVPSVVRIHDQGVVGAAEAAASGGVLAAGAPWFAMERARGPVGRVDDWGTLRRALLAVLDALAAAHAIGLLHLDVKPSNVLVRADGSFALSDFGLAVLRGALGGDPEALTWGSPPYMAPERFDGRPERLVEATDLYAVGCLAFHLAHGAPPFDCPTWERAAEAHRTRPPPLARPPLPVPEGFPGWVRTLLAKRPGDRFETAADARAALIALGSEAGEAGPLLAEDAGPTLTATAAGVPVPIAELLVAPGARPTVAPVAERWEEPTRPRAHESVGVGLLGLLAVPFAGRAEERRILWDELRAVAAGERRVARLVGPAGVGRSRLGEAFARAAAALGGAAVVRVRGSEPDAFEAAARRWLGIAPGTDPARAEEAVALRLGAVGPPPGLPELLRRLAARRPVVVWVDDAEADPRTLAAVAELAREAPPRTLILAAGEATPEGRALHLAPLDPGEVRQLLADWVGLGPELVAELADRCEGDVGLAIAMVGDGLASGRLAQGHAGLEATSEAPLPLPGSALEAWRARLPPDGDPRWPLLERAAALGADVPDERLRRVLPDADPALLRALAVERGLGARTADGWRWASPAARRVALEHAGDRRAAHHLACAEEAAARGDAWAKGTHLLEAGRLVEALPDLLGGATSVIASGGMATAGRRLRQLQQAMEDAALPEAEPAWGQLWRAFGTLGPTHLGFARCRAYNERAADLARRWPDDPAWRKVLHNALGGLCWLANVQRFPRVARAHLDEVAALLASEGRTTAAHHDHRGWTALGEGDAPGAKRAFAEAVRLATERNERHYRYVSDTSLGVAKAHAGDEDAVEHLERSGRAMLDAGYVSARADLAVALGDAERWRGAFARAEEHYAEAIRAAAEGEARADLGVRLSLALLLRDTGREDGARAELDLCRALLRDEGPAWEGLVAVHRGALGLEEPDALAGAIERLLATGCADRDLLGSAARVADLARRLGHATLRARAEELRAAQARPWISG